MLWKLSHRAVARGCCIEIAQTSSSNLFLLLFLDIHLFSFLQPNVVTKFPPFHPHWGIRCRWGVKNIWNFLLWWWWCKHTGLPTGVLWLAVVGPGTPDWSDEAGQSVPVYNREHGGRTHCRASRDETEARQYRHPARYVMSFYIWIRCDGKGIRCVKKAWMLIYVSGGDLTRAFHFSPSVCYWRKI